MIKLLRKIKYSQKHAQNAKNRQEFEFGINYAGQINLELYL